MAASLEDTLLHLLTDTHSSREAPRKAAEAHLKAAQTNPAFPGSLAAIASHGSVAPDVRQSALLVLRSFVDTNWAGYSEDGEEIVPIEEGVREALRAQMLELATGVEVDRKVRAAASYVVSKMANVDYPDSWPNLLPTLLHLIPNSSDAQSHGALKVLADLVEDALSEDQFFTVARDIIKVVHEVAVNETRKPLLRALAVSVFRSTFDIMDMVKEEHGPEVKGFADEILAAWSPFFMEALKKPLPARPTVNPSGAASSDEQAQLWRGAIALKLQVVKTLMKIRSVFPALLLPLSPVLFSATWEELNLLQATYNDMYVENEEQGRLEDVDGLQISLDFLVLEELDFLQSCFRAPPVQKELEAQLQANNGITSTPWVMDVMKLAVEYAQIPKEEEELWDIDVSLFLAEETSVTANYTARTACGDLVIKLGEWLQQGALEGLLKYTQILYSTEGAPWRTKEAALYLVTQLMNDFVDTDKQVAPEIAGAYVGLIDYAINQPDEPLLRARGYLVAGVLVQTLPDLAANLLDLTIKAVNADEIEVVKVSCIKALQGFIKAQTIPAGHQIHIVQAISEYLYSKDLTEIEDSDDLLVTLVESLRAAISLDCRITISGESGPLDLLFSLAKHGASNFQLTMLVTETFEDIVSVLADTESYTSLCSKVLPSLTGAFDVGKITGDDPLVEFATDLLAVLTENGSEPLPPGYVAAVLPKLNRLLMATEEGGVLRSGAETIKYMLRHDHQQVFEWRDEQNRSGLEICLIIIDKLLSPTVEDNAASEVGGLAAELVEKAGQERLGPYLEQLLRAVASRLATAEAAAFIQSLILVFARLSLVGAQDVVQFLSQIDINGQSGLQVVLSKWLENSMDFAGYDEIRQNVIALSKLYGLNDARVVQTMVKGDLIVPTSDRIMTRSKAKLNPDTYTIIPAPLKIIKVLIEELASASGQSLSAAAAAAAEFADDDEEDEGSWEDVPSILDLGLGSTKEQLMQYGEAGFARQRDDETQAYLSEFFLKAGREDLSGFNGYYVALSDDEKVKLSTIGHV